MLWERWEIFESQLFNWKYC